MPLQAQKSPLPHVPFHAFRHHSAFNEGGRNPAPHVPLCRAEQGLVARYPKNIAQCWLQTSYLSRAEGQCSYLLNKPCLRLYGLKFRVQCRWATALRHSCVNSQALNLARQPLLWCVWTSSKGNPRVDPVSWNKQRRSIGANANVFFPQIEKLACLKTKKPSKGHHKQMSKDLVAPPQHNPSESQ